MKKVLIISPHADDEVLSSWTYLILSRWRKIDLHVVYQSVNESQRRNIIYRDVAVEFNFSYQMLFKDKDAEMDTVKRLDIVTLYDHILEEQKPNVVIIPSPSFHQDHLIAYECMIAALRRDLNSSVYISEHPFPITYFTSDYTPNRYIPFDNMDEKIEYLNLYKPFLKEEDINSVINLNCFRGKQIGMKYAETFNVVREIDYGLV